MWCGRTPCITSERDCFVWDRNRKAQNPGVAVHTALPPVNASTSPVWKSSGRMRSSAPSRSTVTTGCASKVSRWICRLALISCTMPMTVLMRMTSRNKIFFHAPTAASAMAIIRFSRLNTVQMLSRKICGMVLVAIVHGNSSCLLLFPF